MNRGAKNKLKAVTAQRKAGPKQTVVLALEFTEFPYTADPVAAKFNLIAAAGAKPEQPGGFVQ
jgi:hypothetical protein